MRSKFHVGSDFSLSSTPELREDLMSLIDQSPFMQTARDRAITESLNFGSVTDCIDRVFYLLRHFSKESPEWFETRDRLFHVIHDARNSFRPITMNEEKARGKPQFCTATPPLLAGDSQHSVTNHLASDISGYAMEIEEIPISITKLIKDEVHAR